MCMGAASSSGRSKGEIPPARDDDADGAAGDLSPSRGAEGGEPRPGCGGEGEKVDAGLSRSEFSRCVQTLWRENWSR